MGRWAQAQRRGGWVNPGAGVPSPVDGSFTYQVDGADPPDFLTIDHVYNVPQGIDGYFWELAEASNPTVSIADGNEAIANLPFHTGRDVAPADFYVFRIAWAVGGVKITGFGPDILLEW